VEIANGSLAMMAFIGVFFQDGLTAFIGMFTKDGRAANFARHRQTEIDMLLHLLPGLWRPLLLGGRGGPRGR
jgi:hypothetical protein